MSSLCHFLVCSKIGLIRKTFPSVGSDSDWLGFFCPAQTHWTAFHKGNFTWKNSLWLPSKMFSKWCYYYYWVRVTQMILCCFHDKGKWGSYLPGTHNPWGQMSCAGIQQAEDFPLNGVSRIVLGHIYRLTWMILTEKIFLSKKYCMQFMENHRLI